MTQVRDDIYLVDVVGRAAEKERGSIDTLLDLQLQSSSGQSVPLSSVATFHYELEQPTIWRRDRIPTITIKAGIGDATQPATVVKALSDKVSAFERLCRSGIQSRSAARSRKAPSRKVRSPRWRRPCSSSWRRC